MSLIDFYCSGVSADSLKDWNHAASYSFKTNVHTNLFGSEPDPMDTNPRLNKDRVRIVADKPKDANNHRWIVDCAIEVTGSHSTRALKEKEDYWNQNFNITLASGIVSTLLGVGSLTASFFVTATWLKVTCIVAAVALVLFAFLSFYRSLEAKDQASLWSVHPTTVVQNQRSLIFEKRFLKAYPNGFSTFFTRKEIANLYEQDVSVWYTRLKNLKREDTCAQARFTEEFLNSLLLASGAAELALGEKHKLKSFCGRFELCRYLAGPTQREGHFDDLQRQLDREKNDLLAQKSIAENDAVKTQIESAYQDVSKQLAKDKAEGYLAFYQEASDILEGVFATIIGQTPPKAVHVAPIERFRQEVERITKSAAKGREKKSAA